MNIAQDSDVNAPAGSGRERSLPQGKTVASDDARLAEFRLPGPRSWSIVQRADDPDIERAKAQLHEDIDNGATGITLIFAGAPNAFGYGIAPTQEAMTTLLGDVPPGKIHLRIDAHPASRTTAEMLAVLLARKRADMSKLSISFGIDPAAIFAGTGALRMSIAAVEASMPQSLGHFFALGAPGILLEANGRVFHNAGANAAQELGVMIASTALYLRMFTEARQPLVYAVPHIGFSLSVDQDQLRSIAKIRALRKLWNKVQEGHGLTPSRAAIHAETSYRMMTLRDPDSNILRSTIAASAAAMGGADTICILPHTIPLGLADSDARRMARNTQLIMADESHIVLDDPTGSAPVDTMTEELFSGAWAEFKRIEAEGGVLQSLSDGKIQSRIAAARDLRGRLYREARRVIVGTTDYKKEAGQASVILDAKRPTPARDAAVTCDPLPALRIDELL